MSSRYEGTVGMWTSTPAGRMFSRCGRAMPIGGRLLILVHGLIVSSRYIVPRLDLPVLVLAGERDPIAPLEWAQQVVRLLPRGELIVVPGAAHIMNWSHPDRFVEAAAQFLPI